MSARGDATRLFAGYAMSELAFRFAQVALPLVVLQETGSVAALGLVTGAAGLPVLTSPWWARSLRQRITSGRGLAAVQVGEAAPLAVVPLLAWLGGLNAVTLAAAGLALGVFQALAAPGLMALFADIGDRLGERGAVSLLTWQDGIRRGTMLVGPSLGGVAVMLGWLLPALWFEAFMLVVSALLALPVRPTEPADGAVEEIPSIRSALVGRPDVARGWLLRGTSCLTWFAFTLGMSVYGAQQDRAGVYFAAGMTAYGVGSLTGTLLVGRVVHRLAPMAVARLAWTVGGLAWIGMSLWTTPWGFALMGGIGGCFAVLGIGAVNRIIAAAGAGPVRRTLMSGQSVVINATSSAGMLLGAPLLAVAGVRPTLAAAGILTTVVALLGPMLRLRRWAAPEAVTWSAAVADPGGQLWSGRCPSRTAPASPGSA
ncbi:MFS transporter [Luteipulveratus mongoliensis]|uniref:MFS transporter n=1 Tax=Luteipulveratus mongoliensis TaxID=571913 RepID=UPI0006984187|nr:MFS transporter [Luteipulveratus mongoliensis]